MKPVLIAPLDSGAPGPRAPGHASRSRMFAPVVTAGVAIAGAGLIGVSPVAPGISAVPERAVDVELTGAVSEALSAAATGVGLAPYNWIDTAAMAIQQASATAGQWFAHPFPILGQLAANQLTYLGMIANGDIEPIPGLIADHIGGAITTVLAGSAAYPNAGIGDTLGQIFGALVIAPLYQADAAALAAVNAFEVGNIVGGLEDLYNIPSSFAYGMLNGAVDGAFGQAGLLTAIGGFPGGVNPVAGGALANLVVYIPQAIAAALATGMGTNGAAEMGVNLGVNFGSIVPDVVSALSGLIP